ncbi:hypothetical protein MKW94_024544 [Papaver nudicaule]|uniref:3'-5' exonuclease domain-containing protein n=1 Tax=Papaver nudicaule TaxID=74823 RepID=A0AA41RPV6_PAPNU|nr:hypothetical protein [Papaver nudicaule]
MTTNGVSIRELPNHYPNTQEVYSVTVNGEQIRTVVTKNASTVDRWIEEICSDLEMPMVGLDVEWKPAFYRGGVRGPIATLQLCVGCECLIFQMIHADEIPRSLHEFISEAYTFVGVGILDDVTKLRDDYDLNLVYALDVRSLAADLYGRKDFKNLGLMGLAEVVLGDEFEKPRNVTTSDWSRYRLTQEQIKYACVDAYVSFKIGKHLNVYF